MRVEAARSLAAVGAAHESAIRHLSATPVVVVTAILLAAAVAGVVLLSFLYHWRAGRRLSTRRGGRR